ncbi:MAG TPA: adenine phosphoribosyltransferase [Pseudonocardiaceae bacterium]|nr:adenine phosphoribosyltransferase [Pseudonocardiaceae bacterium]
MGGTDTTAVADALALIREIPDFPEPGVLFRDLGPVFADPSAFRAMVDGLAATVDPATDVLVAVEARGFLLGAAVGYATGLGVVPVRKPGKTPLVAERVEYQLEYGTAVLELPTGLLRAGQRAAVVDDVLATGGTVAATGRLVESAGAAVTGVSVVVELAALGGRNQLPDYEVNALLIV